MRPILPTLVLAVAGVNAQLVGGQDVISDILSEPAGIQREALTIKHDRFWQQLLASVENTPVPTNLRLCGEANAVIAGLPSEVSHVRISLQSSVDSLRHANEALLAHIVRTSEVAQQRASEAPGQSASLRGTFMRGGSIGDIFRQAVRQFVSEGSYAEQAQEHVHARQGDILPILQSVAPIFGKVAQDCRSASSSAFDVLKHDVYNRGAPRTPESAKVLANKVIDAVAKTRQQLRSLVTSSAAAVADDAEGKGQGASVTVLMSTLPEQEAAAQHAPDGVFGPSEPLVNF